MKILWGRKSGFMLATLDVMICCTHLSKSSRTQFPRKKCLVYSPTSFQIFRKFDLNWRLAILQGFYNTESSSSCTIVTGISWSLKTSPPARLREQWEGGKGFFWNVMVNLESEIMDIGWTRRGGWFFFSLKLAMKSMKIKKREVAKLFSDPTHLSSSFD